MEEERCVLPCRVLGGDCRLMLNTSCSNCLLMIRTGTDSRRWVNGCRGLRGSFTEKNTDNPAAFV